MKDAGILLSQGIRARGTTSLASIHLAWALTLIVRTLTECCPRQKQQAGLTKQARYYLLGLIHRWPKFTQSITDAGARPHLDQMQACHAATC